MALKMTTDISLWLVFHLTVTSMYVVEHGMVLWCSNDHIDRSLQGYARTAYGMSSARCHIPVTMYRSQEMRIRSG